jgi:hypothetical protein
MNDRKMVAVKPSGTFDPKKDKVISGYLRKVEVDRGEYRSKAYTIEKESGEKLLVWGSASIDDQMSDVRIGTFVEIEYLGDKTTKKGKVFKDFSVKVDFSTVPQSTEEEVADYAPSN